MTKDEFKLYRQVVLYPGDPMAAIPCILCLKPLPADGTVLVVPGDCVEGMKMQKGETYEGNFAHLACVARLP